MLNLVRHIASKANNISGYGHSTPKTYWGKLFTMAYATVGIPLGLVMFNSIGERLNALSSIVITKLRRSVKAKQPETTEVDLILVVSTLSAIVVTSGAAAFSHYEGWTYFQVLFTIYVYYFLSEWRKK